MRRKYSMALEDISKYEGTHAFLSPSQPAWLRYTEDHLLEMYRQETAQERGTRIHAWAAETINLGFTQKGSQKNALYLYVNDAIGFHMEPEKLLFHSKYCYGTADSIIFNPKKRLLRIHDLKTGVTKPHADQLRIYAALWCLQNNENPETITFICRFYQRTEVIEFSPSGQEIKDIMNIIIMHEKVLEKEDGGGLLIC